MILLIISKERIEEYLHCPRAADIFTAIRRKYKLSQSNEQRLVVSTCISQKISNRTTPAYVIQVCFGIVLKMSIPTAEKIQKYQPLIAININFFWTIDFFDFPNWEITDLHVLKGRTFFNKSFNYHGSFIVFNFTIFNRTLLIILQVKLLTFSF